MARLFDHRQAPNSEPFFLSNEQQKTYRQDLTIRAHYPVSFTCELFSLSNPCLLEAIRRAESHRRHRVFAVLDRGVSDAWPGLTRQLAAYCRHHAESMELVAFPCLVPGGERAKNDPRLPPTLHKRLHRLGLDRQSIVLIVGGGAVLDMAGYVAATTHRGIRVIRVPTTVLSQADGGVGVKNGINAFGVKNFLGTFAVPFAVINDSRFLDSLPVRHRRSGMAEAVKAALIRDESFFDWLEMNAARLRSFESRTVASLIRRSAEVHLRHIAACGDPFESGSARPLDFGHWAAHKLETLSRYRLHHGEAVAIGMAIDLRYSVEVGLLNEETLHRIFGLLERVGLPTWHRALDAKGSDGRLKIFQGLDEFRDHIGGDLTITLLKRIGEGIDMDRIDRAKLQRALLWLKRRHDRRCVSR